MLKNSLHPKPSKLTQFFILLRQVFFHGSRNYWEKRYSMGGNSGKGSYGESAEFKSDILNNFVHDNNISSVTEYGCGDGNQLRYAEYPQYIGLDISEKAVELSGELFAKDPSKHFSIYDPDEFKINKQNFSSDLVLTLGVTYHLVEDGVYRKYLQNTFNSVNNT